MSLRNWLKSTLLLRGGEFSPPPSNERMAPLGEGDEAEEHEGIPNGKPGGFSVSIGGLNEGSAVGGGGGTDMVDADVLELEG
jgi:hypothetical protein